MIDYSSDVTFAAEGFETNWFNYPKDLINVGFYYFKNNFRSKVFASYILQKLFRNINSWDQFLIQNIFKAGKEIMRYPNWKSKFLFNRTKPLFVSIIPPYYIATMVHLIHRDIYDYAISHKITEPIIIHLAFWTFDLIPKGINSKFELMMKYHMKFWDPKQNICYPQGKIDWDYLPYRSTIKEDKSI